MTDVTELLAELAEHDRRLNGSWTSGMHARVAAAIAEQRPAKCAHDADCKVPGCTDDKPCVVDAAKHDWNMPHDIRFRYDGGVGGCPPNCPARKAVEAALDPEVGTEHAHSHGVFGSMHPHPELHGTEPGQHVHAGFTVPTPPREISAPVEIQAWGVPVLSDAERRVVHLLADAWNTLCAEVVGRGPSREADLGELAAHVHAIQNAVLAQAAARCYPQTYRLMGDTLR